MAGDPLPLPETLLARFFTLFLGGSATGPSSTDLATPGPLETNTSLPLALTQPCIIALSTLAHTSKIGDCR